MNVYPIRCRIRAQADVTRVDVFDDIGEGGWFTEGVSAKSFSAQLTGVTGALEVHINSGGGDVFDGIAIGNAIRAHKGPVTTVVDGIAASIASVIFQAGEDRVVQPGSMLMIHDAFGMVVGNADEARKFADTLDTVSDNIAGIYASRAGGTATGWRDAMRAESWYSAEDAVKAGLADRTGDGEAELPAGLDVAAFHVPRRIAAALRSLPRAAADDSDSDSDDGKVDCPTCKGKGKILHGNRKCPDCHGSGKVTPDQAEDAISRYLLNAAPPACLTCGGGGRLKHPGTGKNGMTCPGCNGTGVYDPDGDGDDDSTAAGDTDHDYVLPDGSPGPKAGARRWLNADKYKQADRDAMAKSGEAMPDGSYPIRDAEDLDNAIHAVGRGGADHDAIRAHIIKRAKALGLSERIPDNWNADGSLADASNAVPRLTWSPDQFLKALRGEAR